MDIFVIPYLYHLTGSLLRADESKYLTINHIRRVTANKLPRIILTISTISLWTKNSKIDPNRINIYPIIPHIDIALGMSFDLYSTETLTDFI